MFHMKKMEIDISLGYRKKSGERPVKNVKSEGKPTKTLEMSIFKWYNKSSLIDKWYW